VHPKIGPPRVQFKASPRIAYNGQHLLRAGIQCSSSPTFSPIKFIKVQITNKSRKEILLPKLMMIVNKKMKIYSSASIEASPMLCVFSRHF
jgi:hypothetical protein